jgi:catechol 2,3-dioxygenase-like lactoylglutathione lyase family enzyme
MDTAELITSLQEMRPAVPAKDYTESQRFYTALGFQLTTIAPTLTEMRLGTHSFLLQDFYAPEFAGNFVMHMTVVSAEAWWKHIDALDLEREFKVRPPLPPRLEPWGMWATYLFDPSGILWQVLSRP